MTDLLKFTKLDKCLCCGSKNLQLILDLKDQPLANSYCKSADEIEDTYPLALNYCADCTHLQLTVGVNPDLLFKNYLYVSGTTKTLKDYFTNFVDITSSYLKYDGPYKVLDIACNDGSQLDAFKSKGHVTYGIDPATNLYELSSKNHNVICDYFNEPAIENFQVEFDIIIAQNVFAHNTYPKQFLEICKKHLNKNGKLFIQTSQADMVKYGQFDTIYHEHISFFNVRSMGTLARQTGLYLEDVIKTDIHGTSYVFVLTKDVNFGNTQKLIDSEPKQTLNVVKNFAQSATHLVTQLKDRLCRYNDFLIIGYGAAAKGNTLLNFGQIKLDYIVDDNPLKQGLYTPGRKIKIVSLDEAIKHAEYRNVIWVPLSWNFFEEIKNRIKQKYSEPSLFVKYFPTIEVELDSNK